MRVIANGETADQYVQVCSFQDAVCSGFNNNIQYLLASYYK